MNIGQYGSVKHNCRLGVTKWNPTKAVGLRNACPNLRIDFLSLTPSVLKYKYQRFISVVSYINMLLLADGVVNLVAIL
jgi:hypothetical protein